MSRSCASLGVFLSLMGVFLWANQAPAQGAAESTAPGITAAADPAPAPAESKSPANVPATQPESGKTSVLKAAPVQPESEPLPDVPKPVPAPQQPAHSSAEPVYDPGAAAQPHGIVPHAAAPEAQPPKAQSPEAAIRRSLGKRVSLSFKETPLGDAIASLNNSYGVEIQLDQKALTDAGAGTDTPVTLHVSGVTLRSALNLMLRPLDLVWAVRDEVLLITTPEEMGSLLEIKVYLVGDLVRQEGQPRADFSSLMNVITATIAPSTWNQSGGVGSLVSFAPADALVCSQTEQVHQQITDLLEKLRKAREAQAPVEQPAEPEQPVEPQGPVRPAAPAPEGNR
ncbi:MAG: hypothetical protein ACYC35_28440 [Pirellulales bacterium]